MWTLTVWFQIKLLYFHVGAVNQVGLTSLTVSDREPKVFLNTSDVFTVSASIDFWSEIF